MCKLTVQKLSPAAGLKRTAHLRAVLLAVYLRHFHNKIPAFLKSGLFYVPSSCFLPQKDADNYSLHEFARSTSKEIFSEESKMSFQFKFSRMLYIWW